MNTYIQILHSYYMYSFLFRIYHKQKELLMEDVMLPKEEKGKEERKSSTPGDIIIAVLYSIIMIIAFIYSGLFSWLF